MTTINTRNKLIRAAKNLFYEKGYSESSIRDIGNKTGISSSIIYHYFKDKEEILFDIIYNATDELIKRLQSIVEKASDPVECLREMLIEHAVQFGHKKEAKIVVVDHYGLRSKHTAIIREQQRQIYDLYKKKLLELRKKGLLNEIDLTVLAFSIFGIINWFFRWHRESGRLTKMQVAKNFIEMVFYGMFRKRQNLGQGSNKV